MRRRGAVVIGTHLASGILRGLAILQRCTGASKGPRAGEHGEDGAGRRAVEGWMHLCMRGRRIDKQFRISAEVRTLNPKPASSVLDLRSSLE